MPPVAVSVLSVSQTGTSGLCLWHPARFSGYWSLGHIWPPAGSVITGLWATSGRQQVQWFLVFRPHLATNRFSGQWSLGHIWPPTDSVPVSGLWATSGHQQIQWSLVFGSHPATSKGQWRGQRQLVVRPHLATSRFSGHWSLSHIWHPARFRGYWSLGHTWHRGQRLLVVRPHLAPRSATTGR